MKDDEISKTDKVSHRGWCIDYSIKINTSPENRTAEKVIDDARKFLHFMYGEREAKILKIVPDKKKKKC